MEDKAAAPVMWIRSGTAKLLDTGQPSHIPLSVGMPLLFHTIHHFRKRCSSVLLNATKSNPDF
jgi:hypothetical protein